MPLKVMLDVMSQPSRSILIFCRAANIPHEFQPVKLRDAEHKTPEFTEVQPLQTVPVLIDDGFVIRDSGAMLRYLSLKPNVEDHWYPKDPKLQARVDEYLHWQHLNTRVSCALYFQKAFLIPIMRQEPPNEEVLRKQRKLVEACLDKIERIWLDGGRRKYICGGDDVSVADIVACCEMEQPSIAGLDVREGRPVIAEYMDRVRKRLSPHYDEASGMIFRTSVAHIEKQKKQRNFKLLI